MRPFRFFFILFLLVTSCAAVGTKNEESITGDTEQLITIEFMVISRGFTKVSLESFDQKAGKAVRRQDIITKIKILSPPQYAGSEKDLAHDDKADIRWAHFGKKGTGKIKKQFLDAYSPVNPKRNFIDITFK